MRICTRSAGRTSSSASWGVLGMFITVIFVVRLLGVVLDVYIFQLLVGTAPRHGPALQLSGAALPGSFRRACFRSGGPLCSRSASSALSGRLTLPLSTDVSSAEWPAPRRELEQFCGASPRRSPPRRSLLRLSGAAIGHGPRRLRRVSKLM